MAVATTISGGGSEYVFSGGIDLNATITSGGIQQVYSGGLATSAVVTSGGEQGGNGGLMLDTVISDGGVQAVVDGVASGTVVHDGGRQYVYGTGTSIDTTVSSSGYQVAVFSGGTVSDTHISGGTLQLGSGAIVSGSINFAIDTNSTLEIRGTKMPLAVISGFYFGGSIDLTAIAPSNAFNVSSATYVLPNKLGVDGISLSIAGPDPVPTIYLSPDQSGGTSKKTIPLPTLLNLSFDTYSTVPLGYASYYLLQAANQDSGFSADAYRDPTDPTAPIIIAFRGTDGGWTHHIV